MGANKLFIKHQPPAASRAAAAVSPSDTVDIPEGAPYGLYIGVAGDVKVDLLETGTAIVFKAAPVGILNIAAKRVYATGTTATNIVALF